MKKVFIIVLIIFVFIFFISIMQLNNKKVETNIYKNLPNYKEKNLTRYISYQNNNPLMHSEDIITRVNLNLDQKDYTYIKESNLLNDTSIFVNKHVYLPNDYIPNNLVRINSKYTSSDKYLVNEANNSLEKMIDDIKKDNLSIQIISAYRSFLYQKDLYDKYVLKDGVDLADTYSARPGYSEHQTGLVIDVSNGKTSYEQFEYTDEYEWMINNSYKYGFILRYPKGKEDITGYTFESWHYRYVGKEIAEYIYKNNITFDEYYIKFLDK